MKSKAFNLNQFKFIMKQTITNFQSSYWQSQYNKALSRLERAVSSGRFAQFTQPPKTQLPNRLSRYARHLGLAMKPTLIAAGIAAGLTLATPSTAQTFTEQTGAANPLNGVDVGFRAAPTFVDIDNDGDKDAFIGESTGTILYYKNTGTVAAPVFTVQTGAANPFNGVDIGFNANPTFVDIDNDGDKDAFIGENDGTINYYKNTGTAAAPVFAAQTGAANPLNGVDVGTYSAPTFVNIDNDGDKDAFIGEINGTILYYKNTGTAAAPVFTAQTGAANPFNGVIGGFYSAPTFVNIDNDGDQDAFIGEQFGTILYYKNTGTAAAPVFAAQTGAANPFNGVDVGTFSGPIFEDIDNDGDKDAFIGAQDGTTKYYKNTTCTAPTTLTPTVSIAASPTGSITVGTSVTFTASPTNGGTTPAYQWKKGSNNVGSNSATYTDVALANNDKITCVLTSDDDCASPKTATSNEITMTVNTPCINPTAYNVTGGSSYCTGDAGVAVGLSNSETGVTYQLKKGGVDEESAKAGTGSALTWANKTAGTYTVVATRTTGGCTTTMTGSAVVTVNPLPTVYTVSGGGVYCPGGASIPVNLSNTQTGVEYVVYRDGITTALTFAGDGTPLSFNPDIDLAPDVAGVYTLVATSLSSTCSATMASSATVTLGTAVTPSVSIAANPGNSITSGTSVTFTATPSNGGTTPVYQWKLNGNNVGTNQNTYTSTTLANGDVITCEMTSNAACASPTLATSNGITMIVNSPCTAPTAYTVTGGGPICAGGVGLPINLSNTLSTTIYQLYLNGSATGSPLLGINAAGTFGPQTTAGTYTVVATLLTGGCTAAMTGSPTIYYPPTVTKFYVNAAATGTNDGSTWANAFTNLQSATDYACLAANAEIWVAAGTYKPSAYPIGSTGNATARDYSFCLQGSTKLYGGFAGTETSIAQRNIATNPTTLSGDIGTVGVATDNVYHIILLPPDVSTMPVLDGFTISGGNANGAGSTVLGATGILRNSGGGIFGQSNGISVANCTFSGNAASQTGGAVSIEGTPVSSYVNCKFLNNSSASVAGGVFTSNPLMVTNCVFAQNTASLGGAGLGYSGPGIANISNTIFSGNNAFIGGAFSLAGGGTVNFGQCTFSGNTGFVSATGTSGNPFFLKNCIVWGTANGIGVNTGGSLSVGNSTVMGALPVVATNLGGNLTTNPLFVNAADADGADNIFGTSDDGLHLQVCSPAVNSGSNTFIPSGLTTDFASNPRIYNSGTVDMGAYELQTPSPIPAVFAMTGGGSYCTGGTGVAIGLSNSETGVTYQLKNGATNVGLPVNGTTGSAISFSNQTTAATYTVLATRTTGGCTATMTGSAVVSMTANVTPSVSIAQSPSGTVQPNTSVMFTATPTNGGTPTYQWQKGGSAISGETNATYTFTSTTAMNGDVITCVMTSNATCASPTTVTSTGTTISVCNCDPTCSPIPGGSAIPYMATTSRTDALGYTHYCDGTGNLLLSLKVPAGITIPAAAVNVKVDAGTPAYYPQYCNPSPSYCFMGATHNVIINRFWHISLAAVTGTPAIGSTNPLSIVSYLNNTDYMDLNTELINHGGMALSSPSKLKVYTGKSSAMFLFNVFESPSMLKPFNSVNQLINNGTSATTTNWELLPSLQTGIYRIEFQVSNLKNSGGIGAF